jgi:rhamnogalacturonan endolyase
MGCFSSGSSLRIDRDEEWTKVIGPFAIHVNRDGNPESLWKSALTQAAKESAAWPYLWLQHAAYPPAKERGHVSGQISISGTQANSV